MDIHEKILGASEEKWQQMINLGYPKSFAAGEVIFLQGEQGEGLYYVKEGIIKNLMYLPNGKEKIFHFLQAPAITGQSGIFDNKGNICTAVAANYTQCIIIPRDTFVEFLLQNPMVMYKICTDLVYKARSTQAQAEDIYASVPKKLARFLLDSYQYGAATSKGTVGMNFTHSDIANIVGTTRQRVTQYMGEFTKMGFIEKKYNCIKVIDYQALSDYYSEGN